MKDKISTKLYRVDPEQPDDVSIRAAAGELKAGNTVVFPTETVYGLGANGFCKEAIKKIFAAKNRPQDNPLILHIAELDELYNLGDLKGIESQVKKLHAGFWPGPLTLILKRTKMVPKEVSAGLDTVAVRMPSHPVALALIKETNLPIAAPSANISGRLSPTKVEHVIDDLWDRVDCIIDAGPTGVGVESTVLDMSSKPYKILRPGGITPAQVEKVLGEEVEVYIPDKGKLPSPGLKYKHYSPQAPLYLIEGDDLDKIAFKIKSMGKDYIDKGYNVGILVTDEMEGFFEEENKEEFTTLFLGPGTDLSEVARNLYDKLRQLDLKGVDIILCRGFREEGIGLALSNRLRKAAGDNILRI